VALVCSELYKLHKVCTNSCVELRQHCVMIEQLATLKQDEVRCACCEHAHVGEPEVVMEHEEVLEILHCNGRHFSVVGDDGVQNPANLFFELSFCVNLVGTHHGDDVVKTRKKNEAMGVEVRGLNLMVDLGVLEFPQLPFWFNGLGKKHVMPASKHAASVLILGHLVPTTQYAEEVLSIFFGVVLAIGTALDLPILGKHVMPALEFVELRIAIVIRAIPFSRGNGVVVADLEDAAVLLLDIQTVASMNVPLHECGCHDIFNLVRCHMSTTKSIMNCVEPLVHELFRHDAA
jgi:hypothetical protein